jgi:membrane protein
MKTIRARETLTRTHAFLTEGMWRAELEPRTWSARGVRLLQFVYMVGEGFVRDRLLLRASALTYFTVLSIVPLLAIVSSILTAVGVTENVLAPVFENIGRVAPQVADQLRHFVQGADIGGLGTLGAVALFFTTVLGIGNIERALNHIWGVKQDRPWRRKLPDYLAVLIVAPLLLGAGLSMATTIKSQWVVQKLLQFRVFEIGYDLGLRQLPTLVLAGAFSFLYWFMPNTSVRPFAAFLGGLVSALAVNVALGLYVSLSIGTARANALYGTFAQLPLFFVWTYFFWAIVLFGAEVAFAYQNLVMYVREVRGRTPGPAEQEAIGLRVALEIGRAFRDGAPPWSSERLADHMSVPVRAVRSVLKTLQDVGIVSPLDLPDRTDTYHLGRPAERIEVVDVLSAIRGSRDPGGRRDDDVSQRVDRTLAELAEGESKSAAGRSLADLLTSLEGGEAPRD